MEHLKNNTGIYILSITAMVITFFDVKAGFIYGIGAIAGYGIRLLKTK